MSAIDTLIAQIGDPRLRERLTAEWGNAKKEKKFGLVFEDHLPELLPLQTLSRITQRSMTPRLKNTPPMFSPVLP